MSNASILNVLPVTLSGKHVRLEPLSEAHIPGLVQAGAYPEIWQLMVYGMVTDEAKMRQWVEDLLAHQAQGTDLPFTVFHQATDQIVGATRYLEIRPEHLGLEIGGTWYTPAVQRTAVNTECKYLLLEHAFETLGCIRVQFKADARNVRSQNAIQRIGAVREGVLRQQVILPDVVIRDSVYFSILDAEWPAVKARLEAMLSAGYYRSTRVGPDA